MGISSFILLVPFFIFAFWISKIILTTTGSKTKSKSVVKPLPGPRKLPLIGHLHILARSSDPNRVLLRDLAAKYGPFFYLQLGEVPSIVVTSREITKEIFKTHDINFANRPLILVGEFLFYKHSDIGFAPYGEYWRQTRKICTLELLSMKQVRSFQPIREEEFLSLCKWIASNEGSPIILSEKVFSAIHDIITRVSLGLKSGLAADFSRIAKDLTESSTGFRLGDCYPSIKFLHAIGLSKPRKIHRKLDAILEKIIANHRDVQNNLEEKTHEDFIDVLLKFHIDSGGGEYVPLTSDNIKAIVLDMIGGSSTSFTVLDWAMAELLKNPEVMKRTQDEVRRVCDKQGYVDESYMNELTYIKLVTKETMRLHPPANILPLRENSEACVIDGYHIPAKTRLLVNVWAMGRDPNYWKDAEKFIPERFLDDSIDFRGNTYEYLPFGVGKRFCPGMSFGLANVEFPLAMLLYHFDWDLANGLTAEEMDMSENTGHTALIANPVQVIPIVKRPLPCK